MSRNPPVRVGLVVGVEHVEAVEVLHVPPQRALGPVELDDLAALPAPGDARRLERGDAATTQVDRRDVGVLDDPAPPSVSLAEVAWTASASFPR